MESRQILVRRIRALLAVFIVALVISGLTAVPLRDEIKALNRISIYFPGDLSNWIRFVEQGLESTYSRFPFMAYGTDWLAFAHIVIAIFFIPTFRNPQENLPTVQSGILACIL